MAILRAVVKIDSPDLGGTGVNVWHLRHTGAIPAGPDYDSASDLLHAFYTDVSSLFHGDTTISYDGTLTEVGVPTPAIHTGVHSWSVVGGTTTPNLPPANCVCVGWRTSIATKSARGRTFLGPISRDCLETNGKIKASVVTSVSTAVANLISGQSGWDFGAWAVWSGKDAVARDFTGAHVGSKFAVLRSRRD